MSSEHTSNPTGGVLSRRVMEEPPSKSQLLEHILSFENIGQAWKRVRANKGAPGIDGITVDEFPEERGQVCSRLFYLPLISQRQT